MENRQRNTVRLVDSNFTKYVLDQPRLYHAAIFLTASARKYECIVCKESIKEYKKAAKYYSENYPDLSKISEETRIVFFALGMKPINGFQKICIVLNVL